MTWRGGARFERCLASIEQSIDHFDRIVLSVTSEHDSPDMQAATEFQRQHPSVQILCTGRELPTMQHQAFWVDHLEKSGARPSDWIYWLAYDDEVRGKGITAITDESGDWPLKVDTAYFGPWAMRHESADTPWGGDPNAELESWTSFPAQGPTRLPVTTWIKQQFQQPTYMQMSGSVIPFANYLALRDQRPTKSGPMRIEMATAACAGTRFVEEFPEPISLIYGRSNSDRAAYGNAAHKEDIHLVAWLTKYASRHPGATADLAATIWAPIGQRIRMKAKGTPLPSEEWRVRGRVQP